jgi:putative flippase GtrA
LNSEIGYINIIKRNFNNRFIKFLFIGVINTVFGYSIYAILLWIKLHYTLALMIATIMGILFNFKTTGIFVFQNNKNRLLYRFILTYSSAYLVNILILKFFKSLDINLFIVQAILVLPMALVSFLLNKHFVFKN